MIFVHLRSYNQLKVKQLTFHRCTKIAVFAKNILCTFTSKTNSNLWKITIFKKKTL